MSLDRRALFERGGKKARMRWEELLFYFRFVGGYFPIKFQSLEL